jgi:hypothetical protein
MKRFLSFTATALCGASLFASSNISTGIEIADGWLFSGDVRAGWLQYDYGNKPLGIDENGNIIPQNPNTNHGHLDSKGFYIIPKISLTSPTFYNLSFKGTLAGATDFGLNDEKYESRNFVFDPHERKSFILLQEAYIKYSYKNNSVIVGREEFESPMIDADDYYMLADSFELARYNYTGIDNTSLHLGYFHKMAGVWDSAANGTEFHSMSDTSFINSDDKKRIGNKGVVFAALDFNNKAHHDLRIWNYYGIDMYNTLFFQYQYNNTIKDINYETGVQIINFDDVGKLEDKESKTKIGYTLYSAKLDTKFNNGFEIDLGVAKYTDGEGQSATLGAWGGYYYYANGMIFHFFEAGSLQNASSYKFQAAQTFNFLGLKNLWLGYRLTYFNLDPKYSFDADGNAQDKMVLNGVRLTYGDKKGAYIRWTYEHVNLDEEPNTYSIRLIGGYKF